MEKVMATLEGAIDKNDGASLGAALKAAYAINPPLDHQMVNGKHCRLCHLFYRQRSLHA